MPILLDDSHTFPDPGSTDPSRDDGLIAVGGDLAPQRLLAAYRAGIFPWSVDPLTWWSPDPRGIFEWDTFHISRSFRRCLRQGHFHVTFDTAFEQVIENCADRRGEDATWISPEFIHAYSELHRLGHAHSVETWFEDQLVGGVYGVVVGGLFAGESMFHRRSDASKVALHALFQALKTANFGLFDIQMLTPVTEQLGAFTVPRSVYLERLAKVVDRPCQFPSAETS